MTNSETKTMTVRTTNERKEEFKRTYEASGATSQNEFLGRLLKKWNDPEKTIVPGDEFISAEEQLKQDESLKNVSLEENQKLFTDLFISSEAENKDQFLDMLLENWNKPEGTEKPEHELAPEKKELKENQILLSLTPAQMFAIRETVLSKGNFAEEQNEIIDSLNYKKPENYYYGIISEPEFEPLWIRNIVLTDDMLLEQKEAAIIHNMSAFLINMFLFTLIKGKIKTSNFDPRILRSFIKENVTICHIGNLDAENPEKGNEILLSLTPAQMFAIRETVLSKGNFAEEQNEIFDSLVPGNEPFLYFGNLFEPEFQSLWIRNIVLTIEMTPEEKETAIKHNMSAFLINHFLMHLIEDKIETSNFNVADLKSFIREQMEDSKPKSVEAPKHEKVTS